MSSLHEDLLLDSSSTSGPKHTLLTVLIRCAAVLISGGATVQIHASRCKERAEGDNDVTTSLNFIIASK